MNEHDLRVGSGTNVPPIDSQGDLCVLKYPTGEESGTLFAERPANAESRNVPRDAVYKSRVFTLSDSQTLQVRGSTGFHSISVIGHDQDPGDSAYRSELLAESGLQNLDGSYQRGPRGELSSLPPHAWVPEPWILDRAVVEGQTNNHHPLLQVWMFSHSHKDLVK
eukprot:CAMPEP_0175984864 /NCGR_PEP_ID=MMETSP0108-20121206/49237_1 /TAXON_ID=195067 ORGANISM="Goniomonas pacifica, Strain CCMP1869" /NCGR_SAMPLE_ID=MMETSP0108 /ASSEMBLY_ACC=CAM_ASM_000204 /LENGTH=164 /DNA_ID=CAMNT_0017315771 /DNA_START=545 /DNA_END=1041 /DNA_ORIENTATION=+